MSLSSFPQSTRPLAYTGNKNAVLVPLVIFNRQPQPGDAKPYDIGTIWLNLSGTNQVYILTAKPGNVAVWKQIT